MSQALTAPNGSKKSVYVGFGSDADALCNTFNVRFAPSKQTFVSARGVVRYVPEADTVTPLELGEMPHARSIPCNSLVTWRLYFGRLRVGPKIAALNA